jgi:hypothetical protein
VTYKCFVSSPGISPGIVISTNTPGSVVICITLASCFFAKQSRENKAYLKHPKRWFKIVIFTKSRDLIGHSKKHLGTQKSVVKCITLTYYKTKWIQYRDLTGLVRTIHLKYTSRVLQNVLHCKMQHSYTPRESCKICYTWRCFFLLIFCYGPGIKTAKVSLAAF